MSRSRLLFFTYAALALLWGAIELYASWTRASNFAVVSTVRMHRTAPDAATLATSMRSYHQALALSPCDPALQHDMLLLQGQLADNSITAGDVVNEDLQLARVQQQLGQILSCRPTDGKAWLDYAIIVLEREGFSKRAQAAYAQSAAVTPNESWLAQRRVVVALQLRPLLDTALRRQVLADLHTLDRANHYRLNTILRGAQLRSFDDLRALFEEPAEP